MDRERLRSGIARSDRRQSVRVSPLRHHTDELGGMPPEPACPVADVAAGGRRRISAATECLTSTGPGRLSNQPNGLSPHRPDSIPPTAGRVMAVGVRAAGREIRANSTDRILSADVGRLKLTTVNKALRPRFSDPTRPDFLGPDLYDVRWLYGGAVRANRSSAR